MTNVWTPVQFTHLVTPVKLLVDYSLTLDQMIQVSKVPVALKALRQVKQQLVKKQPHLLLRRHVKKQNVKLATVLRIFMPLLTIQSSLSQMCRAIPCHGPVPPAVVIKVHENQHLTQQVKQLKQQQRE